MLVVHIEGITYLEHRFYFTEVGRSLTRQCRDLEATTSGGAHVRPLYDEVHAPVLHNNAELHFVVPKWASRGAVDPVLKRRLARMELTANRVWTV